MTLAKLARVAVASALLGGLLAPGGALAAEKPPKTRTYVALGDSYAAGPLIPLPEEPWGCLKSTNNYAKHVAARLGLELRDATCSGAQTRHMTQAQGVFPEANPPQFDRLDPDVDLVTLQIGGNDIGFSGIAETCARAAFEGETCREQYVDDQTGRDELRERIAAVAPRVAAVLQGIAIRAPEARVLVLGYSGIFRIGETASCPAMGVGEGDAQYLRGVHEALNAMLADQADLNGARYLDVYGPSEGKTACDLPVLRWTEPLVPANAAAPIHPNLTGMLGVADLVEAGFTKSEPTPEFVLFP
jgi:lysophospholipase L1-like esterase